MSFMTAPAILVKSDDVTVAPATDSVLLRDCSNTGVMPACAHGSGGDCLTELESNRLARRAADWGITEVDIPGISKSCSLECQNGGRCEANQCVCIGGYSGSTCEKAKPQCGKLLTQDCTMTFENIVPGGTGNDVWKLGDERTIRFDLAGFEPTNLTKKVKVMLINTACYFDGHRRNSILNLFPFLGDRSPLTNFQSWELATVELSEGNQQASVSVALGGQRDDTGCLRAGSRRSFFIHLVPLTANDEPSPDAEPTSGTSFRVGTTGCVTDAGPIGECTTYIGCAPRQRYSVYGYNPLIRDFNKCAGSSVCCAEDLAVPISTRAEVQSAVAGFLLPRGSGDVFIGSTFTATITGMKDGQKCTFTLERCLSKFSIVTRFLKSFECDEKLVQTFDVEQSNQSFDLKIDPTIFTDDGRAELSAQCGTLRTNKIDLYLEYPPCASAGTATTVVGACKPTSECDSDMGQDDSLCPISAAGLTCCYEKRSGNSASFRGQKSVLESAASPVAVATTVLAAMLVACGLQ